MRLSVLNVFAAKTFAKTQERIADGVSNSIGKTLSLNAPFYKSMRFSKD
jgi:hypothetical protein